QETGDRRQETGDRRQETGDRRQETGDRRQETGDRRQETGDREMVRTHVEIQEENCILLRAQTCAFGEGGLKGTSQFRRSQEVRLEGHSLDSMALT
ncbi:MAG: hypothetical protein QOI53_3967, partial [Verrucomicrobiota bacterium]|nr:hypothetical protein [Verrucomicrobiota bacterium]